MTSMDTSARSALPAPVRDEVPSTIPTYASLPDALRACFQRWARPRNRYRFAAILTNEPRDRFYVLFGQHGRSAYSTSLQQQLQPERTWSWARPLLTDRDQRADSERILRRTLSTWSQADYARYYQVDPVIAPPHLYSVQRGYSYSPDGFCVANQLVIPYERP